ncbi:hypothetical protein [uncultured Muribaculum sp.]|uniref:hypothetical protein n=1 Tax=uncultured Muribaculum sp. TaxID=1918613 RepID=UPI0025EE69C1|nr:hypothetical protein [uncultured Muribaculum sp.]
MEEYKFSFLGLFAVNGAIIIALLTIRGFGIDAPEAVRWLEHGTWFWGLTMILSLWLSTYIAKDDYNGVGRLNPLMTQLLAFTLFIVGCMAGYYSAFGQEEFLIPAVAGMCLWTAAFAYVALIGKKLIRKSINPV